MAGQTWLQYAGTYEEEISGAATGITADPAGAAGGTLLTKKFNRVDTVAGINHSVKLPAAKVGKKIFVLNNAGLASLNVLVLPQTGEYIDGYLNGNDVGGLGYVARIPGLQMMTYECYDDGKWTTVKNPRILSFETRVEVLQADIQTSFTTPVTLILQHGSYIIDPISILRTSTNGGYSINTNGAITSDFAKVEQEHTSFDYDLTFSQWKKCIPNANGAYLAPQTGLFFYTKSGNPTGAGGNIKFRIAYNLYLP
jgi:hypothetical protein